MNRFLLLLTLICLLALSAQIKINIIPTIPLTLQTYAICMILIFAPLELASISVCLYVVLGTLNIPVFASGASGINVLFGYTGRYILGFILVSTLIYLIRNVKTLQLTKSNIFIYAIIIHIIIVACGFLQLGLLKNFTFSLYNGLLPLLLPALIKSTIVLITYQLYKKLRDYID